MLKHLGGLKGFKMIQKHLGGIGSEIIAKMISKLTIWSIWAALGPKCSKMVPKLTIWNI